MSFMESELHQVIRQKITHALTAPVPGVTP